MKSTPWIFGLLLTLMFGLSLTGCGEAVTAGARTPGDVAADPDDDDADDEEEVEIPLDQVPENVRKAALQARPGIELTGAEKETEDGVLVYCLEGTVEGKEWEVEVTADGKVLEVEAEDDDGDDD